LALDLLDRKEKRKEVFATNFLHVEVNACSLKNKICEKMMYNTFCYTFCLQFLFFLADENFDNFGTP